MPFRYSNVASDVLNDLREELDITVPNPERLRRLFNKCQTEIATELECVKGNWTLQLPGYACESGLTAEDVGAEETGERTIVLSLDILENDTNDYYNGWTITNTTVQGIATVIDTVVTGTEVTLHLSNAISGQDADDVFRVERFAKSVKLHWSMIRPNQSWGVRWGDDYPLEPVSPVEMKLLDRHSNSTGYPCNWAQENQTLLINPQPTITDIIYIYGVRRPAECFRTTTTSAGDSDGMTLVSTTIPEKPSNYYVGAEIEIISGNAQGDIRTIEEYVPATGTIRPSQVFSAQVGSGDKIELLSPLNEEFIPALEEYLKWKILLRHGKEYIPIALNHQSNYERLKYDYDGLSNRQNTTFSGFNSGNNRGHHTSTYRIIQD